MKMRTSANPMAPAYSAFVSDCWPKVAPTLFSALPRERHVHFGEIDLIKAHLGTTQQRSGQQGSTVCQKPPVGGTLPLPWPQNKLLLDGEIRCRSNAGGLECARLRIVTITELVDVKELQNRRPAYDLQCFFRVVNTGELNTDLPLTLTADDRFRHAQLVHPFLNDADGLLHTLFGPRGLGRIFGFHDHSKATLQIKTELSCLVRGIYEVGGNHQ